jgi:hypothetical protein
MPGRKRSCCSALPKAMITGATITGPKGTTRGAPASAHSSSNRCFCTAFQPGPPNCWASPSPASPSCPGSGPALHVVAAQAQRVVHLVADVLGQVLGHPLADLAGRKASSSAVKFRSIWREALLAIGAVQLLVVTPLHAWCLRGPGVVAPPPGHATEENATLQEALRLPAFWLLTLSFMLYAFASAAMWAHVIPAFESKGWTSTQALAVLIWIGPAQVLGRLVYVGVGRGVSLRLIGLLVMLGMPAALVIFALATQQWALFGFAALFGIANGLVTIVRGGLVPESVVQPRGQRPRYPDKPAYLFFGQRLSFAELLAPGRGLAGWLQAQGVKKGDRVLLYMQNCPQFVVAFYAMLRADAVVVPVNPMNRPTSSATTSPTRRPGGHHQCRPGGPSCTRPMPLPRPQRLQQVLVTRFADAMPEATRMPRSRPRRCFAWLLQADPPLPRCRRRALGRRAGRRPPRRARTPPSPTTWPCCPTPRAPPACPRAACTPTAR